ncbi:hypothetical protein DF186_21515, partial [Enterococcus hirae]
AAVLSAGNNFIVVGFVGYGHINLHPYINHVIAEGNFLEMIQFRPDVMVKIFLIRSFVASIFENMGLFPKQFLGGANIQVLEG